MFIRIRIRFMRIRNWIQLKILNVEMDSHSLYADQELNPASYFNVDSDANIISNNA